MKTFTKQGILIYGLASLFASCSLACSAPICAWDSEKKELNFSLKEISGILSCDTQAFHGKSHHFRQVLHKASGTLISPDDVKMKKAGLLNFFRVLTSGGYLTELRVENAAVSPNDDGVTLTWPPTHRRQAKVIAQFIFREPNIIDVDLSVETLASYPGFEIMLSAYMAPGFSSGVYVSKQEFGPIESEQIRITDQPMIHGIWPFFPRDEAAAHVLTDGRHQKGRYFWRMAVGRKYAQPMAFFNKGGVDVLLMGRPEDVYAVGATYQGDDTNDSIAWHRSMYLSLFGENFQPGDGRRTQMRMIIDQLGSDPQKHAELYNTFLKDVANTPRSYAIDPTK